MFWTIYLPLVAALLTTFAISELYSFCVGYYLHRRQEKAQTKAREEFKQKVAAGEITQMDMMQMMSGRMPDPNFDFSEMFPTTSGEEPSKSGRTEHGQYL